MADEGGGDFWSYHQGRWNATKLGFRCFSFVVSIIIIGIAVNDSLRILEWSNDYGFLLDWYFTLPVTLFSITLDSIELAFTAFWKRNPGLHPGFHIGTELALLGGNITAFIFLSSSIPTENDYYYIPSLSREVRPLKIAVLSFLGVFTTTRFILFVMGSVDTHRHHTAAQVEMIVRALRQQNIDGPVSAAQVHNAIHPNRQPIPLQEFPPAIRPSQDTYNKPEYYRELPDNQKFLGDLPTFLKQT
ncbi:hypothetical protein ANO14919_050430 [Xylariales sp. No.14919]|nr:hypothetical protein F5X98DRAFT_289120 [Xylaria grammica]GAW15626.1 hypothetical protein ANO14919_050430 [Xylariales sp. No.14919]